ncbi:hypothetical protein F5Y03DRAFT_352243 [Xylaria venustula]|nr:hypothetical protein F5Y03DRAFT_352243 [Xylaria venustula]
MNNKVFVMTMGTRALYAYILALWLLSDHVLGDTTTATSSTPTNSAIIPASTFVSPSLNQHNGGLSDKAKVGVSIGVTFAFIIIVGATAILCVMRRRNRTLLKPQTRAIASRDVDHENMGGGGESGKGKGAGYMNGALNGHNGMFQQAPNGFVYQGEGYPTIPSQTYAPHQQIPAVSYPTNQYAETYVYPGTTYPGTTVVDANQQQGYAGPSNTQYPLQTHLQSIQPQQPQQQQGVDPNWIYPVSAISPVEATAAQDFRYNYPQDYEKHAHGSKPSHTHNHNANTTVAQGYEDSAYHIPLPPPNVSELPDQRKPIELMGEGHYKEAP